MTAFLLAKLRKLVAGRAIWAMGDQGMVSLGNFAVNIILARNVSTTDYGIYTLTFSAFLLLSGFHGSVVNYPLILKIARQGSQDVPGLTGLAVMLSTIVFIPLGLVLVGLFVALDRPYLIPWAVLALVAWRFQEVFRRALMAQLKYREAMLGDSVSYLGQAAAMLGLVYFDLISLPAVFLAMAGTSALAIAVQAVQVGIRFSHPAKMVPFIKDSWELGRWVIMRRVIGIVQGQGVGWVLAAIYGVEATASFRAAVNILAVTHPILQGIGNLVEPSVAHAHRQSITLVPRVSWSLGLQGAVLIFPYYFALTFLPDLALRVYYGAGSPYTELGHIVTIMAVGYSISYAGRIVGGTLTGLGKPAVAFHAQLFGTSSAFIISIPLAAVGGIDYAAIGTATSHAVLLIASMYYLRREIARETALSRAQQSTGNAE